MADQDREAGAAAPVTQSPAAPPGGSGAPTGGPGTGAQGSGGSGRGTGGSGGPPPPPSGSGSSTPPAAPPSSSGSPTGGAGTTRKAGVTGRGVARTTAQAGSALGASVACFNECKISSGALRGRAPPVQVRAAPLETIVRAAPCLGPGRLGPASAALGTEARSRGLVGRRGRRATWRTRGPWESARAPSSARMESAFARHDPGSSTAGAQIDPRLLAAAWPGTCRNQGSRGPQARESLQMDDRSTCQRWRGTAAARH